MTTAVSRSPTMPRRRRAGRAQATEAAQASIQRSEIASRAYELFVERGRAHGHDLDDWLAAERELMRRGTSES